MKVLYCLFTADLASSTADIVTMVERIRERGDVVVNHHLVLINASSALPILLLQPISFRL